MTAGALLKTSITYATIQYVVLVIGFVKGIYVASYLGPTLMGTYGLIVLAGEYMRFSSLGVYSAMNLEVSVDQNTEEGRSRQAKIISNAATYMLFTTTVFLGAAILLQSLFYNLIPSDLRPYVYAICLFGVAGQFKAFLFTYARLFRHFRIINGLELTSNVVILVVVLTFVPTYGLDAVVASLVASGILTIFISTVVAIRVMDVSFSVRLIPSLMASGFPLFLSGLFDKIFGTIDRWVIVGFLTREELGYFTLSLSFLSSTVVLLGSFTYLNYPKYLEKFNRGNRNLGEPETVVDDLKKYSTSFAGIAVGVGLVGIVLIEPVMYILLPDYMQSVLIYRVLMIGLLFDRMAYFAATFLVSNRHQFLLMGVLGGAALLAVGLNMSVLALGWGLVGIAVATSVSLFFYSAGKFALAFYKLKCLTASHFVDLYKKYLLLLSVLIPLLILAPAHLYLIFPLFLLLYGRENLDLYRRYRLGNSL